MIDIINQENENLYGGEIWNQKPYCYFYNAPKLKGKLYITRRRVTEIDAKNKLFSRQCGLVHSMGFPSPKA